MAMTTLEIAVLVLGVLCVLAAIFVPLFVFVIFKDKKDDDDDDNDDQEKDDDDDDDQEKDDDDPTWVYYTADGKRLFDDSGYGGQISYYDEDDVILENTHIRGGVSTNTNAVSAKDGGGYPVIFKRVKAPVVSDKRYYLVAGSKDGTVSLFSNEDVCKANGSTCSSGAYYTTSPDLGETVYRCAGVGAGAGAGSEFVIYKDPPVGCTTVEAMKYTSGNATPVATRGECRDKCQADYEECYSKNWSDVPVYSKCRDEILPACNRACEA